VGGDIDSGPTEFTVHEEAIAQLSQPLRSSLTGVLSESLTKSVLWPEVSKDTFKRFVQFAYTGDYSIPSPVHRGRLTPEETGGDAPASSVGQGSSNATYGSEIEFEWTPKSKKDRKKKQKWFVEDETEPAGDVTCRREPYPAPLSPQVPSKLSGLTYPLSAPRNSYEDSCEPAGTVEKGRSYSNVLLSHASLFVLADCKLVDSLKDLALFKLRKTLCGFELYADNTGDIVGLARYAYSDEGQGLEEGVGRLRSLVCQFMAEHALVLASNAAFAKLLSEGGQMAVDLFRFTVQFQ
jgi:hypothetical protein